MAVTADEERWIEIILTEGRKADRRVKARPDGASCTCRPRLRPRDKVDAKPRAPRYSARLRAAAE
jgi:hypothetical protein